MIKEHWKIDKAIIFNASSNTKGFLIRLPTHLIRILIHYEDIFSLWFKCN